MPPASADPGKPDTAIDWFRKRVPIKKTDWLELEQLAQQKSFTIAGIAQLDLIAQVQEAIAKALESGEAYEDFAAKVSERLYAAWGEERAWHVEVVFRNAVQRAYQAGRREALLDEDTLAIRPFLKAEPILDSRTSDFCRPLAGVILPADSPFWDTHWPPLHHNCRTSIRSLTKAQAEAAGVTKRAPKLEPDEGFGGVDPLEWDPDLSQYPADLVKIYRRGQ